MPPPEDRVPVALWRELRAWMLANDPDAAEIVEWSNADDRFPLTADELARNVVWIILCAGRSAQAARTLEHRVWQAIEKGRPVVEAFGYRAKAEAIARAWRERGKDFAALLAIGGADVERVVDWCGSLPFVGDDTKFQLAKNFGADLCKPDIWLCRLAGIPDRPRRNVKLRFAACMGLCQTLATATGDRIAAIDSLLWLACNKSVLQVSSDAGPVSFVPRTITTRSISMAAPEATPC